MPLTLIVTMVILAITIPLIFGSLRSYDRSRVEASVVSEIDVFVSAVQMLYTSGPGNSAVLDFHVASGSFTSVESVEFGDMPGGSLASTIRYTVRNREICYVAVVSPNVPMVSSEGTALQIMTGDCQVQAECAVSSDDLNGDGLFSDVCICLTLLSQ